MIKWEDLKIIDIAYKGLTPVKANLVDTTGAPHGISQELDVFIKQLDSIISEEDDKNYKELKDNDLSIPEINKIIAAITAEQEMINTIKATYEKLDMDTYAELIISAINPYFRMGIYYKQEHTPDGKVDPTEIDVKTRYVDRERIYKIKKLVGEGEDEGKTRANLIKFFQKKRQQVAPTGVAETGEAPTGVAETGVETGEETGVAPTEVEAGVAETEVAETEVAEEGEEETKVETGVKPTGIPKKTKKTIEYGPGDWMLRSEADDTGRTIINDKNNNSKWVRVQRGGGRKTRRKGRKTIKRKKNKKSKTLKRKKRFSRKRHQN